MTAREKKSDRTDRKKRRCTFFLRVCLIKCVACFNICRSEDLFLVNPELRRESAFGCGSRGVDSATVVVPALSGSQKGLLNTVLKYFPGKWRQWIIYCVMLL